MYKLCVQRELQWYSIKGSATIANLRKLLKLSLKCEPWRWVCSHLKFTVAIITVFLSSICCCWNSTIFNRVNLNHGIFSFFHKCLTQRRQSIHIWMYVRRMYHIFFIWWERSSLGCMGAMIMSQHCFDRNLPVYRILKIEFCWQGNVTTTGWTVSVSMYCWWLSNCLEWWVIRLFWPLQIQLSTWWLATEKIVTYSMQLSW